MEKILSSKLGVKTEFFDIISYSTNDRVKELIRDGYEQNVVAAKKQEGGRGRIGRTWLSTDESIALSFSTCPNTCINNIPKLALLAALSASEVFGEKVFIKWPNDLLIGEKKFCGILCEIFSYNEKNYVIVGIGINIKNSDYRNDALKNSTSLSDEKIDFNIEDVIVKIYETFSEKIKVFEKEGFSPFAKDYNERLLYVDKEVSILDSSTHGGRIEEADVVLSGTLVGVNDAGELVIKTAEETSRVISGELSLRKIFRRKL